MVGPVWIGTQLFLEKLTISHWKPNFSSYDQLKIILQRLRLMWQWNLSLGDKNGWE